MMHCFKLSLKTLKRHFSDFQLEASTSLGQKSNVVTSQDIASKEFKRRKTFLYVEKTGTFIYFQLWKESDITTKQPFM
jgi:hypothetical protein